MILRKLAELWAVLWAPTALTVEEVSCARAAALARVEFSRLYDTPQPLPDVMQRIIHGSAKIAKSPRTEPPEGSNSGSPSSTVRTLLALEEGAAGSGRVN